MMHCRVNNPGAGLSHLRPTGCGVAAEATGEQGWALLGLLLALSVLAIFLVSVVTPNIQLEVQRDKEAEMLFRGDQMAKAIARYYNLGNLGPIPVRSWPPYGPLTELKKLKEGITVGVERRKLVRASAMIDPMTNVEWEPVRLRDPRIGNFLQAYVAETQNLIPDSYWLLAGPLTKTHKVAPLTPATPPSTAPGIRPPSGTPPGQVVNPPGGQPPVEEGDDDDDDDDDDPFAHFFEPGQSNLPIVGVAPKLRGNSVRALYGLTKYEDWIFLFIQPMQQIQQTPGRPGGQNPPGGQKPPGSDGRRPLL